MCPSGAVHIQALGQSINLDIALKISNSFINVLSVEQDDIELLCIKVKEK